MLRRAWNFSFVATVVAAVGVFGFGIGGALLQVLTVVSLACQAWTLSWPDPARD